MYQVSVAYRDTILNQVSVSVSRYNLEVSYPTLGITRYSRIDIPRKPNRYPIFNNQYRYRGFDVGIPFTEKYRIPTIEYRKFSFFIVWGKWGKIRVVFMTVTFHKSIK